jgi:hypothetical protein
MVIQYFAMTWSKNETPFIPKVYYLLPLSVNSMNIEQNSSSQPSIPMLKERTLRRSLIPTYKIHINPACPCICSSQLNEYPSNAC